MNKSLLVSLTIVVPIIAGLVVFVITRMGLIPVQLSTFAYGLLAVVASVGAMIGSRKQKK